MVTAFGLVPANCGKRPIGRALVVEDRHNAYLVDKGLASIFRMAAFDRKTGLMRWISVPWYRGQEGDKISWRVDYWKWRKVHGLEMPHRGVAPWEDERESYGVFDTECVEHKGDVSDKVPSRHSGA